MKPRERLVSRELSLSRGEKHRAEEARGRGGERERANERTRQRGEERRSERKDSGRARSYLERLSRARRTFRRRIFCVVRARERVTVAKP